MADLSETKRRGRQPPRCNHGCLCHRYLRRLDRKPRLLLRKRWAWPVLLVSLIALVVLEGWIVFFSGHLEAFGLAVPIIVTVGALLLAWLASHARKRGWLR